MTAWACSDLHGNLNLWHQIQNYLAPDDILFFLGDAADRGENGWQIILELLKDKRVIYLKGNHEDMFVNRISYPFSYHHANLHSQNGGTPTWKRAIEENPENLKEIGLTLKNLPYCTEYVNIFGQKIYMSHSGYVCENINNIDSFDKELCIWDRDFYFTPYTENKYDLIVHGHTPYIYLIEDLDTYKNEVQHEKIIDNSINPYFYDNHKRVDLDCCTILTNSIVLFNLDYWNNEVFIDG